MLRVGVLGLGVGAKHLNAFQAHPRCQVTWVCDKNQNRLEEFSNLDGSVRLTTKAKELLESDDVDVISIATNDEYHFDQARVALENDRHVFIEKPICLTVDELTNLRQIYKKNGTTKLSSNMVLRTCPLFTQIRESLLSQDCGNIFFLDADYLWGRRRKLTSGWRANTKNYSIILGAAIHMIDLIVWLLGERPVRVFGMGNDLSLGVNQSTRNSFGVALLEFANGTIAKVSGNGGCVHPHFHQLEIYGSTGTIKSNLEGRSRFGLDLDDEIIEIPPPAGEYPGRSERFRVIHSFIDSILDDSKVPLVRDEEVFDIMAIGFAIDESIKTKRAIEVNYVL
jgi:predicted dehydrogenase